LSTNACAEPTPNMANKKAEVRINK
jgi:hypothetical protein